MAEEGIPAPYRAEEVRFQHGGCTLAGTLCIPQGIGPHPATVFVAGSGPAARDGYTSLPPIWTEFARRGIASLAWDKPGIGGSTGDWRRQTMEDRARECIAAIDFLKARVDICRDRIGLWGISQAGWVMPIVCSMNLDVAFIIAVSVPVSTGAEQELYRVEHSFPADGFSAEETGKALDVTRGCLEFLQGDAPYEAVAQVYRQAESEPWFDHLGRYDEVASRFLRVNAFVSPRPLLGNFKCPLLVIFGERDTIVNVQESVEVYLEEMEEAGNRDVTVEVFPGADHAILLSETGGQNELTRSFRAPQKPYAPGYLETMGDWIEQRVGSG